jgi:peptidoglycan LD-endopeptidase LytH
MRAVLGPVPPPAPLRRPQRLSPERRLSRPRRRATQRPRRATQLSARQFALVAFFAWALLMVFLDWGLGNLRRPGGGPSITVGRPEAPPPALLPPEEAASVGETVAAAPPEAPRGLRRWLGGAEESAPSVGGDPLQSLLIPVVGISKGDLRDQFTEPRSGGRVHQALDILAPRNTPVVAAADGTVAKLFSSRAGGLTIYQFEPSGQHTLYYAHLESYAPGLDEGDAVRRGQVIGYVGTSGNAPRDVPHLHFAIFRLGPDRRWWDGEAINPYPLLASR